MTGPVPGTNPVLQGDDFPAWHYAIGGELATTRPGFLGHSPRGEAGEAQGHSAFAQVPLQRRAS